VSDDEALRLLSDAAFDLRSVALLTEPLPGPSGGRAASSTGEAADRAEHAGKSGAKAAGDPAEGAQPARAAAVGDGEAVRYLSATPNHIEAEVTAATPALAIFSEAYHAYWKAQVDGRPAALVRGDLAFRVVPVPAGTHRVTMTYEPRAFERGRLVSLVGLAAALAYAAAAAWGSRRAGGTVAREARS
jgi:hypothetical protein